MTADQESRVWRLVRESSLPGRVSLSIAGGGPAMHLLYLDESGKEEHENFVLAGAAVFEGDMRGVMQQLDHIAQRYFGDDADSIELHVTALRQLAWSGKDESFSKEDFYSWCQDMGELVRDYEPQRGLILFGQVIHRPSLGPHEDAYLIAYEGLCKRFDTFLVHQHKAGYTSKGLIVLDRSRPEREAKIRRVASELRTSGTIWGALYNITEVPLFVDSNQTRLLQLADFVAHATFRNYERHHTREFNLILPKFYCYEDVIHGLGHKIDKRHKCRCASCVSRWVKPSTPREISKPQN